MNPTRAFSQISVQTRFAPGLCPPPSIYDESLLTGSAQTRAVMPAPGRKKRREREQFLMMTLVGKNLHTNPDIVHQSAPRIRNSHDVTMNLVSFLRDYTNHMPAPSERTEMIHAYCQRMQTYERILKVHVSGSEQRATQIIDYVSCLEAVLLFAALRGCRWKRDVRKSCEYDPRYPDVLYCLFVSDLQFPQQLIDEYFRSPNVSPIDLRNDHFTGTQFLLELFESMGLSKAQIERRLKPFKMPCIEQYMQCRRLKQFHLEHTKSWCEWLFRIPVTLSHDKLVCPNNRLYWKITVHPDSHLNRSSLEFAEHAAKLQNAPMFFARTLDQTPIRQSFEKLVIEKQCLIESLCSLPKSLLTSFLACCRLDRVFDLPFTLDMHIPEMMKRWMFVRQGSRFFRMDPDVVRYAENKTKRIIAFDAFSPHNIPLDQIRASYLKLCNDRELCGLLLSAVEFNPDATGSTHVHCMVASPDSDLDSELNEIRLSSFAHGDEDLDGFLLWERVPSDSAWKSVHSYCLLSRWASNWRATFRSNLHEAISVLNILYSRYQHALAVAMFLWIRLFERSTTNDLVPEFHAHWQMDYDKHRTTIELDYQRTLRTLHNLPCRFAATPANMLKTRFVGRIHKMTQRKLPYNEQRTKNSNGISFASTSDPRRWAERALDVQKLLATKEVASYIISRLCVNSSSVVNTSSASSSNCRDSNTMIYVATTEHSCINAMLAADEQEKMLQLICRFLCTAYSYEQARNDDDDNNDNDGDDPWRQEFEQHVVRFHPKLLEIGKRWKLTRPFQYLIRTQPDGFEEYVSFATLVSVCSAHFVQHILMPVLVFIESMYWRTPELVYPQAESTASKCKSGTD